MRSYADAALDAEDIAFLKRNTAEGFDVVSLAAVLSCRVLEL